MIFHNDALRPVCILLWASLFALTLPACAGQPLSDEDLEDELEDELSDVADEQGQQVAMEGDESACLGQIIPPRGAHGRQYQQETVISDELSIDEVQTLATERLRDRLCQGILCGMMEQQISIWESNQGGGYRCAMAIIRADQLEEWKRRVETDLGERLVEHAHDVVANLSESLNGEIPRITVSHIRDHGIPGGLRSEWLHRHLQYAMEQADAHVVPVQPNWSGHGLPDRVDGVITAQITPMQGLEASLEVSWQLRGIDRIYAGRAINFPEVVAPDIDRSTYLPSFDNLNPSDKVALHFDSRDGGGLCHGQTTEVWLETAEDMHVRLINLYGRDGGLVIFPAVPGSDDVVRAGVPVSIGQFQAIQHGDIGVERFLVVASPTPEGLGRFETVDQFCRLPGTMAGQLQLGHNLPHGKDTHLFETGFRLMRGEGCEGYQVDPRHVEAVSSVIDSAPSCW